MSDLTLTKTRLRAGVWEGVLAGVSGDAPVLRVTHFNDDITDFTVEHDAASGDWYVRVPVPQDLISDGVQTFVISDPLDGQVLASFAILAGEGLSEDNCAEMDLLRAELDMLKRAFRRHCVETA